MEFEDQSLDQTRSRGGVGHDSRDWCAWVWSPLPPGLSKEPGERWFPKSGTVRFGCKQRKVGTY